MKVQFKNHDIKKIVKSLKDISKEVCVIIAEENQEEIEIIGSNIEKDLFVRCKIPATITRPGQVVLEPNMLCDILTSVPNADIEIEQSNTFESRCSIKINKGVLIYNLETFPNDSYIDFPEIGNSGNISIPQLGLKSIISRAIFSAPNIDTRKVLMGILFDVDGSEVRIVSTNGILLFCSKIDINNNDSVIEKLIVPKKILSEVTNLIDEEERYLQVTFSKSDVIFSCSGVELYSKLIDGEYPNYQNCLMKNVLHTVVFNNKNFMKTLKCCSIMENREDGANLSVSSGKIEISCNNEETGPDKGSDEFIGKVNVDYDGAGFKIRINRKLFYDVLKMFPKSEIELNVNKPENPVMLKSSGDVKSFFHVMPMKLKTEENSEEEVA